MTGKDYGGMDIYELRPDKAFDNISPRYPSQLKMQSNWCINVTVIERMKKKYLVYR